MGVNRLMRESGQHGDSEIGFIPPFPFAFYVVRGNWNVLVPRKQAKITNRDSGFCPDADVKRLTCEPGQIRGGEVFGIELDWGWAHG